MIKVTLTNEILRYITEIEQNRSRETTWCMRTMDLESIRELKK